MCYLWRVPFFHIRKQRNIFYRSFCLVLSLVLSFSLIIPPCYAQAIPRTILNLPPPGTMLTLSPGYTPTLIRGIKIHPDNPLLFDFIVDPGDSGLKDQPLIEEGTKLAKYFLASITVPSKELWVKRIYT